MKRQAVAGRVGITLAAVICGVALAELASRPAEAQPAAKPAAAPAVPAGNAPIVVPDGDAAALDAFIQKLADGEAQGDTQEAQIAYAKKVLKAILEASA